MGPRGASPNGLQALHSASTSPVVLQSAAAPGPLCAFAQTSPLSWARPTALEAVPTPIRCPGAASPPRGAGTGVCVLLRGLGEGVWEGGVHR